VIERFERAYRLQPGARGARSQTIREAGRRRRDVVRRVAGASGDRSACAGRPANRARRSLERALAREDAPRSRLGNIPRVTGRRKSSDAPVGREASRQEGSGPRLHSLIGIHVFVPRVPLSSSASRGDVIATVHESVSRWSFIGFPLACR